MKIAYISQHTIRPLAVQEYENIIFEYNDAAKVLIDFSSLIAFSPDFVVLSVDDGLVKYIDNIPFPVLALPQRCFHKPLRWLHKNTSNCELLKTNAYLLNTVDRDYDDRMHFIADFPYGKAGIDRIQKEIRVFANALQGKRKKCLVLDLDNVLWGGVIGEEGITLSRDGLGRIYYEFQKSIKVLMESGIILAVCSKNNPGIIQTIDLHPDMVLRSNDFASIKINWNNKADNIREITSELNIGLDSIVFFDDSEFERGCVRSLLPSVSVPKLPNDPVDYCRFLAEFDEFECLQVTSADVSRNKLYVQNQQRKKLSQGMDYIEFLKKLWIQVIIKQNHQDIDRIVQLTQRTNQFNFRTKRYIKQEILDFISNGANIFTLEYSDAIGEQGIVGLAIVHDNLLDTFLVSCRVLQKGVESAFLQWILNQYPTIIVEVIPTEKNKLAQDFWQNWSEAKPVDWINING